MDSTNNTTTSILGVAVRDLNRLRQVTTTVVRHGFGELVLRSPLSKLLFKDRQLPEPDEELRKAPAALRFKRLLESLGPTYIKLGQVLSTRPDLLPRDYIEELKNLQDNAPELPFDTIKQVVEDALGASLEAVFADFDPKILGTASIAQTHLARTHEGERVVVKVQRPGIEKIMRGDLDLLYLGAKILEATIEEVDIYSPSDIVTEFEKALMQELNFNFELSNLQTARQLLDPQRPIHVPKPFPDLSDRHVLTMEFFDGVALRKLEPDSPQARHAVEEVLNLGCKLAFVDGFYHGDPHPGNILVNDAGEICLIDWGLVGRLAPHQREDIVTLILAAIANDVDSIARILLKIGTPTRRINMAEFKAEIVRVRSQHLQVGSFDAYDSGQFVQAFMAAANKYRIKLATEYTLLVKVATTAEGLVRSLHPNADVIRIAKPWVELVLRDRYNPQKMLGDALSGVTGVGTIIRHLPSQIDQVMHDVETGNFQVRALTPGLDHVVPALHQIASRVCLALFGAAMSIAAALLLPNDPTTVFGVPLLGLFCTILAVVSWVVLWGWQIVGGIIGVGKARISPLMKFFKRT